MVFGGNPIDDLLIDLLRPMFNRWLLYKGEGDLLIDTDEEEALNNYLIYHLLGEGVFKL